MENVLSAKSLMKNMFLRRILFMLACVFMLGYTVQAQQPGITIHAQNQTLKEVLREIERQSKHSFIYSSSTINVSQKVSLECTHATLTQALDKLSAEAGFTYTVNKNQILLAPENKTATSQPANQQQEGKRTIRGNVMDEKGESIVGANVFIKGTSVGVATDINGNFTLRIDAGDQVLAASFIGYTEATQMISNKETYNFTLKPEAKKLDEVVVVGYGTTKIKDLTGSVASVTATELEKTNATNVAAILQGKAAGVMINTGAAKPGEPVKIRVRGSTSLNGTNEPLYVIDGIPVNQEDMIAINPNDIQSMDILKDASAAAIYGSRAANGVVIITTKRGQKSEKPQLSIHHYSGFDTQIENFSILSADEFRTTMMEAAKNTLKVDPTNKVAQGIVDGTTLMNSNTDWYDLLSQHAMTNNTELAVRGGSDKIRYFVSLAMTFQDGVLKGDDLQRYSGRINLDWDVTNALKFGTNLNLSYTRQNQSGQGLWQIKQFRPDIPVYDENGDYYKIGDTDNPVAKTQITNRTNNYRFNGTIFGELELVHDLKLKSSLSISKYIGYKDEYYPSFLQDGNYYDTYKGKAIQQSSQAHTTLWDNTLSYSHTFNDIHSLDAVVGVSFENNEDTDFSATGVDFPMDHILTNLGSASTPYDVNGGGSGRGLISTFGRINYKLMDKYMFTFTARYDGSSKFGSNNKYGFFPSGAIAWKINKESFLENVTEINELKLRVSAGRTGTQNIPEYRNKDLYQPNDFLGNPGIIPYRLGNNDLKWETTIQYDAAIDYAFLDYRFTGNIAYYYKDTDDLLWNVDFPPSLQPFTSMYRNVGRVVNQGVEFALNADIFRETAVKWDLSLNIAANRNKVKSLIDEGAIEWAGKGNMHGGGTEVLAEGYPVGAILGYRTKGVFQSQDQINEYNKRALEISEGTSKYYYSSDTKPGHLIYEDTNGDGFVSSKDKVIIGNPEPKFFGGISTNVSWKNFSLYAMFNYSVGNERTYSSALQNIPGSLGNLIDYNLDNRWSESNPDSKLPALYVDDAVPSTCDLEVFDASYLKLSNLRIQYELPELLKSRFYKSGQLYFSVSNVFTITHYPGIDPATTGSTTANYGGNYDSDVYPGVRTYTIGLKLNF